MGTGACYQAGHGMKKQPDCCTRPISTAALHDDERSTDCPSIEQLPGVNAGTSNGHAVPLAKNHCDSTRRNWHVSCFCLTELVARVPALRMQGAGPRAAACGGEIPAGARRDKSPGDLVSQGIGEAMVYRQSLFVIFTRGICHEQTHIHSPFHHRCLGAGGRGSRTGAARRRRRTSRSPGRSMSAGCRGAMRPIPASSRNGPTNTASRSR